MSRTALDTKDDTSGKAPVMMISVDARARIEYASDRFCEELGYNRHEVVGQTPFVFQTKESAQYAESEVFPTFLRMGSVTDVPLPFVRKNGGIIEVLGSVTAERDGQGNIARSRSVFIDVTDRKRAEEAIRKSEANYSGFYENAPDMYASVDPATGRIVKCKETLCRATGYSKEEIVGRPVLEMYHPDSLEDAKRALQLFRATGEVHNVELQLRCKDQNSIDVMLNATAVYDEGGRMLYTRSSLRDITERRKAEQELKTSEERYSAIFNSASVGIDVVDAQGRFLQVNEALTKILGYSREELLSMTFFDVSHPADAELSREYQSKMVRGEANSYRFQKRYVKKDGQLVWGDVCVSSILDSTGKYVATIGVISDITKRVDAEAERERLASAIEQAGEAVFVTDSEGTIQYVNPGFEAVTGYSREEAVGRTPRILKSGEHDDAFYR